jgi:hypothetical protein
MSETSDSDKRRRDSVHRKLREMLENAVKFTALMLLLLWASDHVHDNVPRAILRVAAGLCLVPGAILQAICVLTPQTTAGQIGLECRWLRGKRTYRLAVTITIAVVLFVGMWLCTCVRFQ